MSRVRFLIFSQKRGSKYRRPPTFEGREHLGRSCRYNKPVQYGRDAAHISWAALWADSTWGLHGREATPSERRALQPDWEGVRRLEILPSPNSKSPAANIFGRQHFRPPTSFIGREHFNSRLVTVVYYETRTSLTERRYFMWALIFHGREYFMGANISWAQIFHGREYFMGANILM